MRRRNFMTVLAGAAAYPLSAGAQQKAMPVIGYLNGTTPEANAQSLAAFRQGLSDTGWIGDTTLSSRECTLQKSASPRSSGFSIGAGAGSPSISQKDATARSASMPTAVTYSMPCNSSGATLSGSTVISTVLLISRGSVSGAPFQTK